VRGSPARSSIWTASKQINDTYGHDAGDQFLVEVARRLRAKLRRPTSFARLGGDEFFVVLEEVTTPLR